MILLPKKEFFLEGPTLELSASEYDLPDRVTYQSTELASSCGFSLIIISVTVKGTVSRLCARHAIMRTSRERHLFFLQKTIELSY